MSSRRPLRARLRTFAVVVGLPLGLLTWGVFCAWLVWFTSTHDDATVTVPTLGAVIVVAGCAYLVARVVRSTYDYYQELKSDELARAREERRRSDLS